jgi:hypothetical protein
MMTVADAAAFALLCFDIRAELKFEEFEMFEAGSQDFCSTAGLDKRLGFIDFCAVQHEFFISAGDGLAGAAASSGTPERRFAGQRKSEQSLSLDIG